MCVCVGVLCLAFFVAEVDTRQKRLQAYSVSMTVNSHAFLLLGHQENNS